MRSLVEIEKSGFMETLSKNYINIKGDLEFALSYFSSESLEKLNRTKLLTNKAIALIKKDMEVIKDFYNLTEFNTSKEEKHELLVKSITSNLGKNKPIKEYIVEAAKIRRSLG